MAATIRMVPVSQLVEDFELYPRHAVDERHVVELARALQAGATLPPILIDATSNRIIDGWHRRRAVIRINGEEAQIRCELRKYATDADMFADAVAYNSQHGRRLDAQDHVRVTLIGERLKLTTEKLSMLLHVEPARIDEIKLRIVVVDGQAEPAKQVAAHLYGAEITREQAQAMRSFSGVTLANHVRQVHRAVATDLFNKDDPKICEQLRALARLIEERVPGLKAA